MDPGARGWRYRGWLMVGLAALTLASCANTSHTVTSAAGPTTTTVVGDWDPSRRPDPCRLLTRQEVAAEFGRPVGQPRRIHGWPPSCQFIVGRQPSRLLNVADDTGPEARANFEQRKASGAPLKPVSGVGGDAYWLPQSGILHALSGSTRVFIAVGGSSDLTARDRRHAITLARVALRRALQPAPPNR
jgi:hypothetical protein